jgi:two-component sensor histidine kinase
MRLYLILSFSFLVSFGQNIQSPMDSLRTILNTKKTSYQERVEILNKLVVEGSYFRSNDCNREIYTISKKNKYLKGLGYYYQNEALKSLNYYDDVKADFFLNKASSCFKKPTDSNNYINSIYLKCFVYQLRGKRNYADQMAFKTINLYKNKPNSSNIARLYYYISMGNENSNKRSLKTKIYFINKALEIFVNNKNYTGILDCYKVIIKNNFSNQLYDNINKNLDLLNQTLSPSFKLSINYLIYVSQLKASIYAVNNQYNKSIKCLKKTEEILKRIPKNFKSRNDEYTLFNTYLFLAESYIELKKFNDAKKYISLLENFQLKNLYTTPLKNYVNAKFFLATKFYEKAFYFAAKFYEKAFYIEKINYTVFPVRDGLKLLSETEFALKKYKLAYEHQAAYSDKLEKQFKKDNKNQIAHYDALFQLDKKNLLINNSKLQNEKKEAELQKQKLFISALIISSLSLIIIFILTVLNFKNKQKSTRLIAVQNEELSSLNQLLQNSLNEKELLLKEIHHRVKNNLQLVMSLLNIQAADTNNTSIEEFLEKGRARISTIALIHQNLYLSESVSQIDFQNYLDNLTQQSKMSFGNENIEFEVEASQIKFDLDTAIPLGLIINELVTNSLKHAFPNDINGKIVIAIESKNENQYQISVSDNGIGMVKKAVSSTKSIGMELVHLLVMQLNGSIEKINTAGTYYIINFQTSKEY